MTWIQIGSYEFPPTSIVCIERIRRDATPYRVHLLGDAGSNLDLTQAEYDRLVSAIGRLGLIQIDEPPKVESDAERQAREDAEQREYLESTFEPFP